MITWAQGTFAYCFGLLVPLFGLLAAIQGKRGGVSVVKSFFKGCAVALLGFLLAAVVAKLMFPRYPSVRVPELLANAFTIPGVIAGVLYLWRSGDKQSLLRLRIMSVCVAIVAYVVGLAFCYRLFTWEFRRALPWSATDVHEWYRTDTLLPDYSYQLKAKISNEQFRSYVNRFRLTPHVEGRPYTDDEMWLDWRDAPGIEGDWWNPSDSLTNTFVWQGNDTWIFAKYEGGHLYLASLNH